MDKYNDCSLLVQGRGEMAFFLQFLQYCYSTVLWIHGMTAVLLVQSRGKNRFCLQLLQYCYITVLWIHGLSAVLLVKGRGEKAVLPAVIAVQLHHSAMDTWNDYSVVSRG
jgi:hypothetical protein